MPKRSLFQLLRDYIFFNLCGIPTIIGLKFSASSQNPSCLLSEQGLYESEAKRLGRLIVELGPIDYEDRFNWDISLLDSEYLKAKQFLAYHNSKKYIAISVGTKLEIKDWGRSNWSNLVGKLSCFSNKYCLVAIGSADEFERCEEMLSHWNGEKINLCGRLSPRISAAILSLCTLLICHDSGPMHLAASVRTATVSIFSSRSKPGHWFPYGINHSVLYNKTACFGCNLSKCDIYSKRCIMEITVESVLKAVIAQISISTNPSYIL